MKWTCELVEERLSEHLDGLLAAEEERGAAGHVAGCARCTALVARVSRTLTAVHGLDPVELPPELVPTILDKTLGPKWKRQRRWAGLLAGEPRKRWPGWLGWIQPAFQPRFAMGFATVIFLGFITLTAAGVDIRLADLNPKNMKRQAHLMYARSVKFVNDLRVVSEIQSRLQTVSEREGETDTQEKQEKQEKKEPAPEDKRKRESNQLNQRPCDLCSLAAIFNGLPGRSIR
jgi:anti-sigma factor RsiW